MATSPRRTSSSEGPEPGSDYFRPVSVDPPVARLDTPVIGRDNLRDAILRPNHLKLADRSPAKVHILYGLGGSGKTHLALGIAAKAKAAGRTVWWVSASQLSAGMREVANQLHAPENEIDRAWAGNSSASDLVWRYLNETRKPWVLIFDNADDPDALGPSEGHVADGNGWLREPAAAAPGLVVVTTRLGTEATWGPRCSRHVVDPLSAIDGASLLLTRATDAAGTLSDAAWLSEALGGLPLALRTAGDYLRSVHQTRVFQGADAIRTFSAYHDELRRRIPAAPGRTGRLTELLGTKVVEEVFTISLDLLNRRGLPQAAPLVRTLAVFDSAALPYISILKEDVLARSPLFSGPSPQLPTVLEAMADLSLISTSIEGPPGVNSSHLLLLHPLVQTIARNDEETRADWNDYQQLAIDLLLTAVAQHMQDLPASWPAWHVLEPHATVVARDYLAAYREPGWRTETARMALELAWRSMRYLIATRLLMPAEENLQTMIASAQASGFRSDSPEVLSLRHELARVALERKEFASAEVQIRAVIEERTRVIGPGHPDTLASRHKLMRAIMGLGRWAEAEQELREILHGEEQLTEPRSYDANVVRHTLGRAIRTQGGRAAEAEGHVQRAITELSEIRAANDPELLFAHDTLAQCLSEQGRFDEAEWEVRRALSAVGPAEEEWEQVGWLHHTLETISQARVAAVSRPTYQDPAQVLAKLRQWAEDIRSRQPADHPDAVRAAELIAFLEMSPDADLPDPRNGSGAI